MSEALRIGLAGLGTVGVGVVKILTDNAALIAARAGRPITITAVSARDKSRDRGVDLSGLAWEDDATALAGRDDVDLVVELIGGSEGVARTLVEEALGAGKHVVTANKALVAHHGRTLAIQAEKAGVALNYEAAVAGGIPIVKAIREGLAANTLSRVYGILNGTCNYILTEMEATGRAFGDVLKDAQDLGYAEADPSFDIGGIDAAHKLAILAALGFGHEVGFDHVHIEGIETITADDIRFAQEFGYRIKLIGLAEKVGGTVAQSVSPALVPLGTPMADVMDAFNAVAVDADPLDQTFYEGRGAGEGPTASAVVADLIDIARGLVLPVFGVPASALTPLEPLTHGEREGEFYVRLSLKDEPGGMAMVARAFADQGVSIASMLQRERAGADPDGVPVVFLTHETKASALEAALETIQQMPGSLSVPRMLPIATFAG